MSPASVDRAAIARRAADRGMKASTYLAALARAHVRANPPIPAPELAALKESVAALVGPRRETHPKRSAPHPHRSGAGSTAAGTQLDARHGHRARTAHA